MAKLEIAGVTPTLDHIALECGYSGDVSVSEPGALIFWPDVPEQAVSESTETISGALVESGFDLTPDDASAVEVAGLYRGTNLASLILEISDGVIIKAAILWIDPERIGDFEAAALEWAVPRRLLLSLSTSPSGC